MTIKHSPDSMSVAGELERCVAYGRVNSCIQELFTYGARHQAIRAELMSTVSRDVGWESSHLVVKRVRAQEEKGVVGIEIKELMPRIEAKERAKKERER